LEARSIKACGGRLAVDFAQFSGAGVSIKVIDLNGNPITDYKMDEIGSYSLALACYGTEGFTMVP